MQKLLTTAIALFLIAGCTSIDVKPVAKSYNLTHVCIKENPKVIVQGFISVLETSFEKQISDILTGLTNDLGKSLANELGATQNNTIKSKTQLSNLAGITGGLFESAIASLGQPFTEDQATFDFPQGLGSAVKKWSNASELATIPVDAKRTWNAKSKSEIAEKAAAIIASPQLLNVPKSIEWKKGENIPKELANKLQSKNIVI
jgi:hypothetical protein